MCSACACGATTREAASKGVMGDGAAEEPEGVGGSGRVGQPDDGDITAVVGGGSGGGGGRP